MKTKVRLLQYAPVASPYPIAKMAYTNNLYIDSSLNNPQPNSAGLLFVFQQEAAVYE